MKRILILLILVLSFSLITGCSSAKVIEKKTQFMQNEMAKTESFEINITNVHTSYGNGYAGLEDGYVYVVVDLSIKNISDKKQSISTMDWKMQNGSGIETDTAYQSQFANEMFSVDVLPKGTINGSLYFEEPMNNSGLKLAYYSSIFDKDSLLTFTMTTDCSKPKLSTEPYAKTEKINFQDIEYSIVETKTSKGKGYVTPSSGKIFLGVRITAKNMSGYDTGDISSYGWKIVDSNGVSYDSTYMSPWDEDYFSSTDLAIGGTATWFMTFEVPSNLKWQLAYFDSMFNGQKQFSFLLN